MKVIECKFDLKIILWCFLMDQDLEKSTNHSSEKKDNISKEEILRKLDIAQKESKENRERFQSLFEQSNDAIILLDPKTQKIDMINNKFAELFGVKKEEIDQYLASTKSCKEISGALIAGARERNVRDNVTVVVVRI